MREVEIDLTAARPQKLTAELAQSADLLVTMGCGDKCPYVPGLQVEDWPLDDPKGQPIERVREIRDEIRRRVTKLLNEPTAFVKGTTRPLRAQREPNYSCALRGLCVFEVFRRRLVPRESGIRWSQRVR